MKWMPITAVLMLAACVSSDRAQPETASAPDVESVPPSLAMGGAKSVTTFFVTSAGIGRGGDLGGLAGADAVTERLDPVNGAGDTPNRHDILTGSTPDGTAFEGAEDLTCGNWTSSGEDRAQVGHHDRMDQGAMATSWNSAHPSRGCSLQDLQSTGGDGLFYRFAID